MYSEWPHTKMGFQLKHQLISENKDIKSKSGYLVLVLGKPITACQN